jgi:hypothetical protein
VGIENIQVSGATQGIPTVAAPSMAALTTASQVVAAAANESGVTAQSPRTKVEDLPSIVTVEVVGYETTEGGSQPPEKKEKKRN